MTKIKKCLFLLLVLSLILTGIAGCSSKNVECKVTLDREGNLDIIVNPPGESDEAEQHGGLARRKEISASGGSHQSVTTYEGEIEKLTLSPAAPTTLKFSSKYPMTAFWNINSR